MTHNELCNIEATMQRAVNAAKTFAEGPDRRRLDAGMQLLAEIRHAGMFLCCDDGSTPEMRGDAIERLIAAIRSA